MLVRWDAVDSDLFDVVWDDFNGVMSVEGGVIKGRVSFEHAIVIVVDFICVGRVEPVVSRDLDSV